MGGLASGSRSCFDRNLVQNHHQTWAVSGCSPAARPLDCLPVTSAGGRPLARFSVLDLTTVRSRPTCTRILADFSADVIRVERPGGEGRERVVLAERPAADWVERLRRRGVRTRQLGGSGLRRPAGSGDEPRPRSQQRGVRPPRGAGAAGASVAHARPGGASRPLTGEHQREVLASGCDAAAVDALLADSVIEQSKGETT